MIRKTRKLVNKFGKKLLNPVFNLRIGQGHGFLQSVSNLYVKQVKSSRKLTVFGHPDDKVNTLFISDLGEVICKIVNGEIQGGTYSVLSQPQWTQRELYDYYLKWTESFCLVEFQGHSFKPSLFMMLRSNVLRFIESHRGFIDVVILQNIPWLALRAKGMYRVKSSVAHSKNNNPELNLLGTPPDKILGGSSTSPKEIYEKEVFIRAKYESFYTSLLDKS